MTELGTDNFLLSLLVTWIIGLLPPIVIRYAILKRPTGKGAAAGISILFWLFNFVIFTVLGSQSKTHAALAVIAFVSYKILCRGAHTYSPKNNKTRHPSFTSSTKITTKDQDYIVCSACNFEQWSGYDQCQKCGATFSISTNETPK